MARAGPRHPGWGCGSAWNAARCVPAAGATASSMSSEPFRLLAASETERGLLFSIEIPAGSRLFEGHFPGHPILPGIAHLALAERALGAPLTAVRSLKLRRPVVPGEVLELSLRDPDEEAWVRFELRRDGEPVSSGAVWTVPSGEEALADEAPRPTRGFPPVERLLPHAPPARLLG